jgi:hypothetical protein
LNAYGGGGSKGATPQKRKTKGGAADEADDSSSEDDDDDLWDVVNPGDGRGKGGRQLTSSATANDEGTQAYIIKD